MSNWQDWIFVLPKTPDCGWVILCRDIRRAWTRIAVERKLLTDNDQKMADTNARKIRGDRKERPERPRKGAGVDTKMVVALAKRTEADGFVMGAGRLTVEMAALLYPRFTWSFWREYFVEAVKRGVVTFRPASQAKDDTYEWRNTDSTATGGGG